MDIRVTRVVLEQLRGEAARALPDECCGILFGHDGAITEAQPTANTAADRTRSFEIDPQALIDAHRAARAGGPAILGYYHSHPEGDLRPSAVDAEQAEPDGMVWLIAGAEAVTAWRAVAAGAVHGRFDPLGLEAA